MGDSLDAREGLGPGSGPLATIIPTWSQRPADRTGRGAGILPGEVVAVCATTGGSEATMSGEIFGLDGLIVLLVALASLGLAVWALADAAVRPGQAFKAAGQSKTLWILLPIVGIFVFSIVGGLLGVVYLVAIRPKVRQSQLGW
jgi:Protein of unknown function (DUF2516)